jgi:hypothetical protein
VVLLYYIKRPHVSTVPESYIYIYIVTPLVECLDQLVLWYILSGINTPFFINSKTAIRSIYLLYNRIIVSVRDPNALLTYYMDLTLEGLMMTQVESKHVALLL